MGKCPECGGNMISKMKRKICETCGLSLNGTEYDKAWDKVRDTIRTGDDDKKRKRNSDYLKWYESSKK